MSDELPPEPPDDEFPGNVIRFKPTKKPPRKPPSGGARERRVPIPVVPSGEISISKLINDVEADPSRRAHAAAVLRSRMYSFEDIAQLLGYVSAGTARAGVVSYVLSLDKGNELETLRFSILGAVEAQARRSIAMASADAFEDADGNRYPNSERLAWHKEARQDLEALARISGAQAAVQLKITPESEELDAIVRQLEIAAGRQVVEAEDVLVLEVFEDEDEADTDAG